MLLRNTVAKELATANLQLRICIYYTIINIYIYIYIYNY